MYDTNHKFVDFEKYCKSCKHKDLPEIEYIYKDDILVDKKQTVCFECQEISARVDSGTPVKYEEQHD